MRERQWGPAASYPLYAEEETRGDPESAGHRITDEHPSPTNWQIVPRYRLSREKTSFSARGHALARTSSNHRQSTSLRRFPVPQRWVATAAPIPYAVAVLDNTGLAPECIGTRPLDQRSVVPLFQGSDRNTGHLFVLGAGELRELCNERFL